MRDGFPGGAATGTIGTLAMCWLLDPRVGPIIESEAVSFFAIAATIAAAAIAYAGILRQIRHQNEIEDVRKLAELEAERAAMPIALSRICEISRRGIQDLVGHGEIHGKLADENMSLDATHVQSIKTMIKVSTLPVRVRLQAILRGYQVALASTDWDLSDPLVKAPDNQGADGYTRISLCYRWALLHALAESLFNFSRGGSPDLDEPFPNERLLSAVKFAGVVPEWYTDFEGFFQRAIDRAANEPLEKLFIERLS